MSKRRYVVLAERTQNTDLGDVVFVLLGFCDAHTRKQVRRQAASDYELAEADVVVVPASHWR